MFSFLELPIRVVRFRSPSDVSLDLASWTLGVVIRAVVNFQLLRSWVYLEVVLCLGVTEAFILVLTYLTSMTLFWLPPKSPTIGLSGVVTQFHLSTTNL